MFLFLEYSQLFQSTKRSCLGHYYQNGEGLGSKYSQIEPELGTFFVKNNNSGDKRKENVEINRLSWRTSIERTSFVCSNQWIDATFR